MQSELGSNVATHLFGRRRRQRKDWGTAKVNANLTNLTILWSKVVAPLGYAMCLVNGKECNTALGEGSAKQRRAEALRSRGVALRTFLLVSPPFVRADEQDAWLLHSIDVALSWAPRSSRAPSPT